MGYGEVLPRMTDFNFSVRALPSSCKRRFGTIREKASIRSLATRISKPLDASLSRYPGSVHNSSRHTLVSHSSVHRMKVDDHIHEWCFERQENPCLIEVFGVLVRCRIFCERFIHVPEILARRDDRQIDAGWSIVSIPDGSGRLDGEYMEKGVPPDRSVLISKRRKVS